MIITPAPPAFRESAGTHWASLARRGMLWSEVQVMDVTAADSGEPGPFLDPDCLELVYCSRGSATFRITGSCEVTLLSGQMMLIAPGDEPARATAAEGGAELLRIRLLPQALHARIPARWPGLEWPSPPVALGSGEAPA